jgi:hypothetical protein
VVGAAPGTAGNADAAGGASPSPPPPIPMERSIPPPMPIPPSVKLACQTEPAALPEAVRRKPSAGEARPDAVGWYMMVRICVCVCGRGGGMGRGEGR